MGLLSGQIIGEYRLVSLIGVGGMGEVYLAEQVQLRRAAVVKILKHLDASSSSFQRFSNEARIQAGLNHPNIATFYAYYDFKNMPCIIMEYVDGLTIDQILAKTGRFNQKKATNYFFTIAKTIQYIHEKGIIHRDIKPHNIKISSQGVVKLLDFGISKATFSSPLTAQGQCIGTDNYLSPEQLDGKPASVASDIWALGTLFHEMLTGQKAFVGQDIIEIYRNIKNVKYTSPTIWLPDLPQNLECIIATCLKKSPARRYTSAHAICQALRDDAIQPYQHPCSWWQAVILRAKCKRVALGAFALLAFMSILGMRLYNINNFSSQISSSGELVQDMTNRENANRYKATYNSDTKDIALMRTVRIDVLGPPAVIFFRTNNEITNDYTTPYQGQHIRGSHLYFTLKREGFKNCSGDFIVADSPDSNEFTYRMCRVSDQCSISGCK